MVKRQAPESPDSGIPVLQGRERVKLHDWLAEHPPPDSAFTQSAAGVASRVVNGEPFLPAVRELLDEFRLLGNDDQSPPETRATTPSWAHSQST